jgi:tRNA1(Val) A37 N6-methylase TrmN6
MQQLISILIRAAFTFVAFLIIQYAVPYYYLVLGGLLAAVFMWFTSSDRALAIGVGVGALAFGIFAFLFGQV